MDHTAEAIVSIGIFSVGVLMMIDGSRVGSGWAFDGPMPGYFPFRIGAILCISSLVILLRTRSRKQCRDKVFVTWERFRLVLKVLVPTVLYVLVTQLVGIYVASAVFIGAFMRMNGGFPWLKIGLIIACITVTLFFMFEVWFLVPLPKGPLESLFGY